MKLILALSGLVATVATDGQVSTMETFQVPALYPEGIAYDAVNNRLVLGSFISPSLVTVNASDPTQVLTAYARSDYVSSKNCLGLKTVVGGDGVDGVMCAQSNTLAGDEGALVSYSIPYDATSAQGNATATDTFPYPCDNVENGTGCGLANDLVIVDENTVYGTDTTKGRVIKFGDGTPEVLSEDALLMSATGSGANGIAYDDGVLIVSNHGEKSLVTVDAKTGEAAAVEIDGAGNDGKFATGPDGLLLLPDDRLVVITAAAAYVLSQVEDGAWSKAKVDETISFADQVAAGEQSATASLGPKDNEVYVTFVRFADLRAGNFTMDPATIGKITVAPMPTTSSGAEDDGEASTKAPTKAPTKPTEEDDGGDKEGGATPATSPATPATPAPTGTESSGATFALGSITAAAAIALGVLAMA